MIELITGLLKNATFMGFLGVLLGSSLSFAGVMYSESIKLKTIKVQQELQQKQTSRDNLRKVCRDFLHLTNKYVNYSVSVFMKISGYMSEDDARQLLKEAERIMAELDIEASKELSKECRILFNKTFTQIFNKADYDAQREVVIDLMKKELAER